MSPILDTGLKIRFDKTRRYARRVTNIDVARENSGDRAHPGMKTATRGPKDGCELLSQLNIEPLTAN